MKRPPKQKGMRDMPDKNLEIELLDELGGEQLEGSGFENEIPESDSEWGDPR
jgi:hypothetical protein